MKEFNLSANDWIKKVKEIAKEYREITIGNAKIINKYHPPRDYFYLKIKKLHKGYYAPALYIGNTLFMTIKPSELQSQILPIKYAKGRVLVAGLGMGYYVNQIIKKHNVKKVDVVELSQDVIEIYQSLFSENNSNSKLNLINEDIFNFKSDNIYDFFYIDIWPGSPSEGNIDEIIDLITTKHIKQKKFFVWETENWIWSIKQKYPESLEYFINVLNLKWAIKDIMDCINYFISL